jgi:hypothetical protein
LKPRLFIGSSSENLDVAWAMQTALERVAEVTVWDQGVFSLSRYNLEALLESLFNTDFGAFVFAPNDVTNIRGEDKATVRDNVIFELGLFVGRLGRERCFIVLPKGDQGVLHLPTDLLGLTPAQYVATRQDGNLLAALGPACAAIARNVENLGPLVGPAKPPKDPLTREERVELTEQERMILTAMISGEHAMRSLTGLARDSKLPKTTVNLAIASLMKKALVEQERSRTSGQLRWFPTELGRRLAAVS